MTAAATLALGGCGNDGGGDIGARDAAAMLNLLDQVESQVRAEQCDGALATAGQLETEVANLTDASDDTINALAGATESLKSLIIEQCGPDDATTTTRDTDTDTDTETTTVTQPTTTTTTTQTTSATTTTTAAPPPPDDDDTGGTSGGGVEAPGGGNAGGNR